MCMADEKPFSWGSVTLAVRPLQAEFLRNVVNISESTSFCRPSGQTAEKKII